MSALNFKIIDLDDPDLPSNDRDIYEAMLERMLADPMELEVEASESAAPAAATSAEAAVPASKEPTLGATAERQLSPVQAGDVGGSAPSAASDAAEEVVGEPTIGMEWTLVAPSPPTVGVGLTEVEAPETLSPARAPVDETTPTTSPSLVAPQEHDAPGSVAREAVTTRPGKYRTIT
jgi:hypothetical protein